MQQLLCKACRVLWPGAVAAFDDQIVDVQLRLAEVLHRRADGADVVAVGREPALDEACVLGKVLHHLCQHRNGAGAAAAPAGKLTDAVGNAVKPAALEQHGLGHVGIGRVDVIVAVFVRISAHDEQQPAVELVGAVDAVLQLAQNLAHLPERDLKAHGVRARRQIEAVVAVFVSESAKLPVVAVLEGDFLGFGKGHAAVDEQLARRALPAVVVLAALEGQLVPAVCRHVDLPLDPLTVDAPGAAARDVQDDLTDAVRLGVRRRTVKGCIQRRRRTHGGVLALNDALKIRRVILRARELCAVAFIVRRLRDRLERKLRQRQRLGDALKRQQVLALVKAEAVRLRLVAVSIVGGIFFRPAENLKLLRTDLVALIVGLSLTGRVVRPQPAEGLRVCAAEGADAVEQNAALCVDAARGDCAIDKAQPVPAVVRNVQFIGDDAVLLRQKHVLTAFVFANFRAAQLDGRIQRHVQTALWGGGVAVFPQIFGVGSITGDLTDICVQIDALIFFQIAFLSGICPPHQQRTQRRSRSDKDDPEPDPFLHTFRHGRSFIPNFFLLTMIPSWAESVNFIFFGNSCPPRQTDEFDKLRHTSFETEVCLLSGEPFPFPPA